MNCSIIRFKYIPIKIAIIIVWSLINALAQDVYLQGQHRGYETYQSFGPSYRNNNTICYMEDSNETHNSGVGTQSILDGSFVEISDWLVKSMPYDRYDDWMGSSDGISTLPIKMHCSRSSCAQNNGPYWVSDPGCQFSARLIHGRYWAASAKPEKYPRTSMLKITKLVWTGSGPGMSNTKYRVELPECVMLTIPANSLRSDTHDFNNKFTLKNEFDVLTYECIQVDVTLLAVEVSYVDRDVMTNQWAQKKSFASFTNAALFAGPHSGDMVEWRLPDGLFQNQTISWKAKHIASGEINSGPSGVGVNFWRIANDGGNDPEQDEWLKWKPGEYMITCEWDGKTVEIQRVRVGYRSDHILVIGQIVPTFSHDLDKPIGGSAGLWASAVADDITSSILPAAAPLDFHDNVALGMGAAFLLQSERGAEAWAACWAGALGFPPGLIPGWWPSAWIPPPVAPPAVPLASAGPAFTSYGRKFRPMGTMTARHHYWATQHMLNTNPDTPTVPAAIFTKAAAGNPPLAQVFADKQYRVFHEFQAKFLLTNQGKIEQSTFVPIHNRAAKGTTKLKVGEVNAGDWGTAHASIGVGLPPISMPLPPFDIKPFPDEDSETNLHNERVSHAAAGDEVSSFATARIGEKGRRVSYRQFGKDAPWIFSEIIFHVESDWKVNLMGRTSTTVQWDLLIKPDQSQSVIVSRSPYAPASTPSVSIFNNLNLYARSELDQFILIKNGLLNMEGHLQSFVESGSGAWPEPPIPPTVK